MYLSLKKITLEEVTPYAWSYVHEEHGQCWITCYKSDGMFRIKVDGCNYNLAVPTLQQAKQVLSQDILFHHNPHVPSVILCPSCHTKITLSKDLSLDSRGNCIYSQCDVALRVNGHSGMALYHNEGFRVLIFDEGEISRIVSASREHPTVPGLYLVKSDTLKWQ